MRATIRFRPAVIAALSLIACTNLPRSPTLERHAPSASERAAVAVVEPEPEPEPEPPPPPPPPICLVLSVGELKGIAHIGAIKALEEAAASIDCVVGNSMGSLIGALYASAPREDTSARFRALTAAYATASREAAGPLGLYAFFDPRFHRMSLARMTVELDRFLGGMTIESTPIRFATAGQRPSNREVVYATSGNLARAVSDSIANPLVFGDVDLSRPMVDPGLDQISATPISAACHLFPAHRIIAINVTRSQPLLVQGTDCPVLPVTAYPGDVGETVLTSPREFDRVVAVGYEATRRALAESGWVVDLDEPAAPE